MSLSEAKFKRNTSSEYSQSYDPLKRPIYDWKRKKKLSPNHPKYTMSWLAENAKFFDSLSFLHIVLLTLFWTKRNICHSFKEITEDCGLFDRHAAMLLMYMLQGLGFVTINEQSYRGKYRGRNWYKLTYKGQKLLKLILKKAFRGTPIPTKMLPIEIKKNYPNFIKTSPQKSKVSESGKHFFTHITKLFSLRSNNKKNMLEKPDGFGEFSFEEIKKSREWLIWNPALFDSGAIVTQTVAKYHLENTATLHQRSETPEFRRRKALKLEYDSFKNCERRKLFQKLGAGKIYDEKMHIGIWRALEKEPLEKIAKALNLMKKKIFKGKFRMKNIVGFFTHLMKNPEAMGYSSHKAKIYRDAIDGKQEPEVDKLLRGETCAKFVALARELEAKTGEVIDTKTLAWMLGKGDSQVWLKATEAVNFRRRLDDPNRPKPPSHEETRMPILPGSVVMEDVTEDVTMKKNFTEEVAARDESGQLKRDENGKIVWEQRTLEKTWTERRVTGQREVPMKTQGDVAIQEKAPKQGVKSWVGLWVYAVNLGSVEAIDERFFQKKEEAQRPMPRLPGCEALS